MLGFNLNEKANELKYKKQLKKLTLMISFIDCKYF